MKLLTKLQNENQELNERIKKHFTSEEKAKRNEDAQYIRSSLMIEIAGIHLIEDEDTKQLVCKIGWLKLKTFNQSE